MAVGYLLTRAIFDKPSQNKNNNTQGKNYGCSGDIGYKWIHNVTCFLIKRQLLLQGRDSYIDVNLVIDHVFEVYNCVKCCSYCIKCKKINFFRYTGSSEIDIF